MWLIIPTYGSQLVLFNPLQGNVHFQNSLKHQKTSVLMFSGGKEREKGPGMGLEAALNSSSVK